MENEADDKRRSMVQASEGVDLCSSAHIQRDERFAQEEARDQLLLDLG